LGSGYVSEAPHGRQVVAAARRQLAPLGLFGKGRSRVWLGDRLWYPGDDLSFDLGSRVEEFHPYESES
jgi:hypothetical protein